MSVALPLTTQLAIFTVGSAYVGVAYFLSRVVFAKMGPVLNQLRQEFFAAAITLWSVGFNHFAFVLADRWPRPFQTVWHAGAMFNAIAALYLFFLLAKNRARNRALFKPS